MDKLYMVVGLAFLAGLVSSKKISQPNIVVILADDLGFNDVPWHNKKVIAPHLMNLAQTGVILDQHYSQPSCSPTRSALLTGRYPFRTGMEKGPIHPWVPDGLPTEFKTLADDLKKSGYSTHIVGKWHLGFCNEKYLPTNRGFDHHYGFWNSAGRYYTHKAGGHYDMMDDERVAWEANGTYSTQLFHNRATKIISEHDQSKPLFLYLPFQSVHGPLEVPYKYKCMQDKSVIKSERRTFLGMVTAMDDAIGEVTKALENAKMMDNTIIIFFSDNGAHPNVNHGSNLPLRGRKFEVWEGGTRTPAFVHGPGLVQRTEERMMHVVDWYPTIMAAINQNPSQDGLDGLDLWETIRNGTGDWKRDEIVYNIRQESPDAIIAGYMGAHKQAAIRMGDWKFIQFQVKLNGKPEPHRQKLFNLAQDPNEQNNVAKHHPELVEKMNNRISQLGRSMYQPITPAPVYKAENLITFKSGHWVTGWC